MGMVALCAVLLVAGCGSVHSSDEFTYSVIRRRKAEILTAEIGLKAARSLFRQSFARTAVSHRSEI